MPSFNYLRLILPLSIFQLPTAVITIQPRGFLLRKNSKNHPPELKERNDQPMNFSNKESLAHELRFSGEDVNMATKMKVLKMLQEVKGLAQITNRRPAPRPPLLYLMALRSQEAQTHTPRRRLVIEAAALTAPSPIKINHIKTDQPALPVTVC